MTDPAPQPRHTFRRHHRLSGKLAFRAVFDGGCKASRGPLTVFGVPNGLSHSRLGLTIGRRVGNAVRRHRLKRKLREAFRLSQHDWPIGYDWVITARPHDDMPTDTYRDWLGRLVTEIAEREARRKGDA